MLDLTDELFEVFQIMVFEIDEHRQHRPQSCQQSGGGVWAGAFGLTAAEADQRRLQLHRGRAGVGLQLPDGHAGHRGHQHPPEDRRAGFLLPMFQLLAVRLEQFEITFNAPSPVVTAGQLLRGQHRLRSIRQQVPGRQRATAWVADLHDDQPQRERRPHHVQRCGPRNH